VNGGVAGGLQRVFLVAEGVDPRIDREAAWRLLETVGEEIIFCGAAVKPTVGGFFHKSQRPRRSFPGGSHR